MVNPGSNITNYSIMTRRFPVGRFDVVIRQLADVVTICSDDASNRPTPILRVAIHERHHLGPPVGFHTVQGDLQVLLPFKQQDLDLIRDTIIPFEIL